MIGSLAPFAWFVRILALAPFGLGVSTWLLGVTRYPDAGMVTALDSDLRFLGGILGMLALLIFWISFRLQRHGRILYFVFCAVLFGTLGRLVSREVAGPPEDLQLLLIGVGSVAGATGLVWLRQLRSLID